MRRAVKSFIPPLNLPLSKGEKGAVSGEEGETEAPRTSPVVKGVEVGVIMLVYFPFSLIDTN